jgi:hypothetical protein
VRAHELLDVLLQLGQDVRVLLFVVALQTHWSDRGTESVSVVLVEHLDRTDVLVLPRERVHLYVELFGHDSEAWVSGKNRSTGSRRRGSC